MGTFPAYILNLKLLFLIGLLLLVPKFSYAQFGDDSELKNIEPTEKIDMAKWEKYASKYDYSKERKKSEPKKENEKKEKTDKKKSDKWSPQLNEIVKYSLFGIVILFLAFIAFKLLSGGLLRNQKVEKLKIYSLNEIDENLENFPIKSFLDEAVENNNFRLAIRLLYLQIIQTLNKKGMIHWKKDKTNGDYLNEMSGTVYFQNFSECTKYYERVWFNEVESFEKTDFVELRPMYENLISELQNINA